jgi:hypothetical protein
MTGWDSIATRLASLSVPPGQSLAFGTALRSRLQ